MEDRNLNSMESKMRYMGDGNYGIIILEGGINRGRAYALKGLFSVNNIREIINLTHKNIMPASIVYFNRVFLDIGKEENKE